MPESTESPKIRPETWVIAGLAAAGLAAVSLVAVALVVILRQGGPAQGAVTASPVINIQTAAAPTPGIQRPAEPAKPQANRSSAQDPVQPALPLKLQQTGSVSRADQQAEGAAARASLPAPDARINMLVRGQAPALPLAKRSLPMPVRYRVDAQGRVEDVYASRQAASKPLPPDRPYADSGASGAGLELQALEPRSTYALNGFTAPEGFSFFTARLQLRSKAAQAVGLDLADLELRDSDGTVYLANPELSGPLPGELPAGQQAEAVVSFLVSEQSPLSALALRSEGAPILLPLARR